MQGNDPNILGSKKRPRHVLPQEFACSFSDKSSFYKYMKEQL